MRPLIGITKPSKGGGLQNIAIKICLFLSGAKTINLHSTNKNKSSEIEGLVLSGGTDLHPGLYKSSKVKNNYSYDTERDQLELEWLNIVKEKKLPIFCICRGAQLLNVFEGGTLHFNVSKFYDNADYPNSLFAKIFYRKSILIKKQSLFGGIIKKKEIEVNSMHSQSIDELGSNLEISAKESNGVVQAIESDKEVFIIGVQFHPEFLYYKKEIRDLFKKFVFHCARKLSSS